MNREFLSAPDAAGKLPHIKLVHLVFQGAQRNSQVFSRSGDIPSAFLEGTEEKIPLERVCGFLEQAVGPLAFGFELSEMELERQVFLGNVLFVADCDQPLDQVLELTNVSRPPVLL